MNLILRILLSGFLSFAVIVTGSPVQLFLRAHAQSNTEPPKPLSELGEMTEADAAEEMDKNTTDLKKAFLGEATGQVHLDQFQLTNQRVIDDRPDKLNAVIAEHKIRDFIQRIEYLELQIREIDELVEKNEAKLSTAETEDQVKEHMLLRADLASRRAIAVIDLEDIRQFDPREGNGLSVELMLDQEISTRHYYGHNLKLLIEQGNEVVNEVHQKDFTEAFKPGFNKLNPLSVIKADGDVHFTIANGRGEAMHQFFKPVEAIFFYGDYLIYIEKEAVESERGVVPVRYIDLRDFRSNIGNSVLPVYTMPLKVDGPLTEFGIEDGFLKLGPHKISYPQLAIISRLNRVLFDVSVALVDPSSYQNAKELIKNALKVFEISMAGQDAVFQKQMSDSFAALEYGQEAQEVLSNRPMIDLESAKTLIEKAYRNKKINERMYQEIKANLNSINSLSGSNYKLDSGVNLSGFIRGLYEAEQRQLLEKASADNKITEQEYKAIKQSLDAGDSITEANNAAATGRAFYGRFRMLLHHLVQPRREGVPKLHNTLIMAAFSRDKEVRSRSWKFAKDSPVLKMAKYGAGVGGVILAASQMPESSQLHLYKSLELISHIHAHFMGYLEHIDYGRNYAILSKDAVITSTTGWTNVNAAYLTDGKWVKFAQGLGFAFYDLIKIFVPIHFGINSFVMLKKTFAVRQTSEKQLNFFRAFLEAADQDKKQFFKLAAGEEKKVSGSDVDMITEAEEGLLKDHLQRIRDGRDSLKQIEKEIDRSQFGRQSILGKVITAPVRFTNNKSKIIQSYLKTVAGQVAMTRFGQQVGKAYENTARHLNLSDVKALRSALAHSFISFSAMTNSFWTTVHIWNPMFIFRSFAWSAQKLYMFLAYPRFFGRTIFAQAHRQHVPSRYNGGLSGWPEIARRVMSNFRNGAFPKWSNNNGLFYSKDVLEYITEFEKQIISAESVAAEVAKSKAERALIEQISDPERLMAIYKSSERQGEVSTGIRSLHDKKLKELTPMEKLFYRSIFDQVYDRMVQGFVSELTPTGLSTEVEPKEFAKAFMAELRQGNISEGAFTESNIEVLRPQLEAQLDMDSILQIADDTAHKRTSLLGRMSLNYRYKLLQSIHPNNPQVKRYKVAIEKSKDPQAMIRASRAELSGLIAGLPIGLVTAFALYAGVEGGMLQPFDANGWDTETHYRYMNRYLVYNDFVMGTILGIMAGTWMKLQEDARIAAAGGFDRVVSFADSKRSFWRFYVKSTFKNPMNKWMASQIYYLQLIWANIPAAAVTITVMNLYGMGRVDVGAFIGSYIVMFVLPFTGFGLKLGQAIELALLIFKEKIPRKFRAHQFAQQYINKKTTLAKMKAMLLVDIPFSVIITENLVGSMVTLKDNAIIGTRGFLRLFFGSDTPTQLIVKATDWISETLRFVPYMDQATDGVKFLFSNNYEAFERFPERLPMPPVGVERIMENPELPKSWFAELIGKSLAALSTSAAVASVPYVVTGWMQKHRERAIQDKGNSLLSLPKLDRKANDSVKASGGLRCSQVFSK